MLVHRSESDALSVGSLEVRYLAETGTVHLTGIQALVRVVLDAVRSDARDNRQRTGAFVSGYEGSPLGGLDLELARRRETLEAWNIVHRPAINEEIAATAVSGSQIAAMLDQSRFNGALGVWYGKAPGLDRERRHTARKPHGHRSDRWCPRAGRRRSDLEVVDVAERFRACTRRPRDPGPLPRGRARDVASRSSRRSSLPDLWTMGRDEDGDRRRRRIRHLRSRHARHHRAHRRRAGVDGDAGATFAAPDRRTPTRVRAFCIRRPAEGRSCLRLGPRARTASLDGELAIVSHSWPQARPISTSSKRFVFSARTILSSPSASGLSRSRCRTR